MILIGAQYLLICDWPENLNLIMLYSSFISENVQQQDSSRSLYVVRSKILNHAKKKNTRSRLATMA